MNDVNWHSLCALNQFSGMSWQKNPNTYQYLARHGQTIGGTFLVHSVHKMSATTPIIFSHLFTSHY